MYLVFLLIFALALADGAKYQRSWLFNLPDNNYRDVRNVTARGVSFYLYNRPTVHPTSAPPPTSPTGPYDFYQDQDQDQDQDLDLDQEEDGRVEGLEMGYHKRVPRHPHDNYNRVDGSSTDFDEDYPSDQAPAPGFLTAEKEKELGTPSRVQASRQAYEAYEKQEIKQRTIILLARAHNNRLIKEAECKVPKAQVIYMIGETNIQYYPRATILHRCDSSTGCCRDGEICSVKKNVTVELPFVLNNRGKMIPLVNHTECECVQNMSRRKRSTQCQCPKHFKDFSWRGNVVGAVMLHCRCDCHLNDAACQRLKNGEEGFAMNDRIRIQHRESSQPICNYGLYDVKNGRCPRPGSMHQLQTKLQTKLQWGKG
ncbi:uncharacterized protein LOC108162624 [Drosophila miranda]|uniref:uncharacterized protein LOC108162624 n=1 Tax=Drosophila miranda TaxID=7229 RepID=UPI0007E7173F|nr:uncharacterized protein LOC108162624 [Drosophila miranda]XP_033249795.1 uncharacterized protein LOC108162624 [Drosophila miranda]